MFPNGRIIRLLGFTIVCGIVTFTIERSFFSSPDLHPIVHKMNKAVAIQPEYDSVPNTVERLQEARDTVPKYPLPPIQPIQPNNVIDSTNVRYNQMQQVANIQNPQIVGNNPEAPGSLLNFLLKTPNLVNQMPPQLPFHGQIEYNPNGLFQRNILLNQAQDSHNNGAINFNQPGIMPPALPNHLLDVPFNYRNLMPILSMASDDQIENVDEKLPPPVDNGLRAKILRWNGHNWMNLNNFCAGDLGFNRTRLKSPVGDAIINIHAIKDDRFVSKTLKTKGLWAGADITTMINSLSEDPNMGFIDIGSHVGTFSLVAAQMGRQVVAVDPLVANVLRFCKSVQENNFTDKVTIFYTALSDVYTTVSFKKDFGNIGGTRIVDAGANVNITSVYDPNFINTVHLDDLLPHIPFRKAFMKIDVEEHEYQVLTSGINFFKEMDITGILMEWMWQRNGVNGKRLLDFLISFNFLPFVVKENHWFKLSPETYRTWPADVLWKKIILK